MQRKVYDLVFIERKLREGRFRRVIAKENGAWLREVIRNGLHFIATLRQSDQVSSLWPRNGTVNSGEQRGWGRFGDPGRNSDIRQIVLCLASS